MQAMPEREALVAGAERLLKAAAILQIPVLASTQNRERLGEIVPQISAVLRDPPLDKMAFSCCAASAFIDALNQTHRRIWVVCGVEAHICVSQTALDLLQRGHRVHVVADAVSSRSPGDREIGLRKVAQAGAVVTSVETVLYEWLGEAGTDEFREVLKLVR